MHILSSFKKKLYNFSSATKGVAAVEFALILPVMLLIYLGTVEASRAISYHTRIISIAAALGDLVGQSQDDITTTQLNDYFTAAQKIIAPYPSNGVRQKITNIHVDDNGNASVVWSRDFNGGTTKGAISLPQNIINISKDNYVIVSEVELAYKPITSYIFPINLNFYQKFYHLPRAGNCINLNNSC